MRNGKVTLEFSENVATLTLNDPASLNAFGVKLKADLSEAIGAVEAGGARCLLLTGAGRAFCSGANLNDPDKPPVDREAEAKGLQKSDLEIWYNPTFKRLRALPIPVVSAINGVAAGAGMSLALSADIKLMAKSAFFLQAFARIGLVPDAGSTWLLPRLVGLSRAMELSLLAERLPAETAADWGLVNEVVEDAELPDRARAMAKRLAEGPSSLGLIRRMYWDALENDYAAQLQLEAEMQKQAGRSADHAEGVAAFREKRPATFKGA